VQRHFTEHPVLAVIQLCSTLACGTGQLLALHVSSTNTPSCFGGVRWSVLCAVVRVACGVMLSLCRLRRLAQVFTHLDNKYMFVKTGTVPAGEAAGACLCTL
jgi:hypothetical protein